MPHVQVRADNGTTYISAAAAPTYRRRARPTVSVPQPSDPRKLDIVQKTCLWQQACREIAPVCSAGEFIVFSQIFDRSIGWGRDWCFTTAKLIANGDGNVWSGCAVSDRTVKRCLSSLEEKGLIRKQATRNRGTMVQIVLEWKGKKAMIAVPKRLKGVIEETEKGDNMSLIDGPIRDTVAHDLPEEPSFPSVSQEVETEYSPEASGPGEVFASVSGQKSGNLAARENLQGLIERTNARIAKKQEKNIDRAKQRGNPLALETIWRQAVAMHFPEIVVAPAWTKAQHGIVMAIAKKWTAADKLSDFAAFLEWCVVSWPAIMRQQFKWMTKQKPPMAPDFRFWAKFHEDFLNCYHSGKLSKWMRAADRDRLEFLKQRGKTHEEALFEIAKEQATKEMADKNRETLNAVRQAEHRIAERQKMLRKQEDRVAAGVPIHPKSEAAKKLLGTSVVKPTHVTEPVVDLDDLDAMLSEIKEQGEE